eukprot:gnl/Dysnectes_brevis/7522_a12688_302.p1 GENE.gnl/Dysnectes_brevis/7522_a12688_302~~gnl/Dysnectes_brevis/7522_a12688_302.p1  ORF type:complete len:346 (-),score=47.73 gnl/Dysnectes_brevis/7522_a12688_302:732-1769(-)
MHQVAAITPEEIAPELLTDQARRILEQNIDVQASIVDMLSLQSAQVDAIDVDTLLQTITLLLQHVEDKAVFMGLVGGVGVMLNQMPPQHSLRVQLFDVLELDTLIPASSSLIESVEAMRLWCGMLKALSVHGSNLLHLLEALPSLLDAMSRYEGDYEVQRAGLTFLSNNSLNPSTRQRLVDSTVPEVCVRAMKLFPGNEDIAKSASVVIYHISLIPGVADILIDRIEDISAVLDALYEVHSLNDDGRLKDLIFRARMQMLPINRRAPLIVERGIDVEKSIYQLFKSQTRSVIAEDDLPISVLQTISYLIEHVEDKSVFTGLVRGVREILHPLPEQHQLSGFYRDD